MPPSVWMYGGPHPGKRSMIPADRPDMLHLWQLNFPITPGLDFGDFSLGIFNSLYAHQFVAYGNVFGNLATSDNKSRNQAAIGSGFIQFQPIEGLTLKGSVSAQQTSIITDSWRDFNNWYFNETPSNPFGSVQEPIAGTEPGIVSHGLSKVTNITKALNLNYTKSFGNHNLDVILDASSQEYDWTTEGGSGSILTRDPTLRRFSPGPNSSGFFESRGSWALIGYLARATYNFNHRYYAEAVIRRDGSSRFAPGNKWGTFPSGSVGWRISQEKFMEGMWHLSMILKLRGRLWSAGK